MDKDEIRPGKWLGVGQDGWPEDLWPWLALAVVAAVLIVTGWRALRRGGRVTPLRGCRWRRAAGGTGALRQWTCRSCGVEAFTSDGHPPKECKRRLKGTL